MPSGHHQVADALIDSINSHSNNISCKKIEFLSNVSPILEKSITSFYMKWISFSPNSYSHLYYRYFYTKEENNFSLDFYEKLFLRSMEKLISKENPDLIICTHSFPSFLISRLKTKGKIKTSVINAYTDFFINSLWGKKEIDYHLVPDHTIKSNLVEKFEVPAKNIKVSGVPVHEGFQVKSNNQLPKKNMNILISGGSSGLGDLKAFLKEAKNQTSPIQFTILCGKNNSLFNSIRSWKDPLITPVPYLSSRKEMNRYYEEADAIVTKPGGVTISEALRKQVPIFVHSYLPGQEDVNLDFLLEKRLIFKLNNEQSYIDQMTSLLKNNREMLDYQMRLKDYTLELELKDGNSIFSFIEEIVNGEKQPADNKESLREQRWPMLKKFKKRAMSINDNA